jgi:hypothetical protein
MHLTSLLILDLCSRLPLKSLIDSNIVQNVRVDDGVVVSTGMNRCRTAVNHQLSRECGCGA